MKERKFNLSIYNINDFFPHKRIKDKIQTLLILLEATRYMLNSYKIEEKNTLGNIMLRIDKMSRLFFCKENKYYSIIFPFSVKESSSDLKFYFKSDIEVDSELISHTISTLKNHFCENQSFSELIEEIEKIENKYNEHFGIFLRELLLIEDGYIRYDKDDKGYNTALLKGVKHKHPLNHYDIYYSNKVSFKIGLNNDITIKEFIDLLDNNSDCKYLTLPK